jgi:hypothetical protein
VPRGFHPELVGLAAPAFERPIDFRVSALYAAGTLDGNPRYLDDRRSDLASPPMLAAALTASGNAEIGAKVLQETGLSAGDFARQVHYSEVIEFAQPLRPGMVLMITPRVAALRPHRLGTEFVLRFDAMHEGKPAFREHLGTLVRDVFCEGLSEAVELSEVPNPEGSAGSVTPSEWTFDDRYDALFAHIYDGCSGISYSVHTSPRTAEAAGLRAPLVHGTAVFARSLAHAVNVELDGDPGKIRLLSTRFAGMVFPGDTVTTSGTGAGGFFATKGDAPILRDCLLVS